MIKDRIVITGIGLTSPLGNDINEFRSALLLGKSGIKSLDIPHFGLMPVGKCDFDETKYQSSVDLRRGTRAGSISIYTTHEALKDANLSISNLDYTKISLILGVSDHGSVNVSQEVENLVKNNYNFMYWNHHTNTRSIANNPSGEVSLNLKIKGPHYCIGGACAAGNIALINGIQQLKLKEIDVAIVGGVSEATHSYCLFANFLKQNALANHKNPSIASRPFDKNRNGVVISEGGCVMILERLENALKRDVKKIYGEVLNYAILSDAKHMVHPSFEMQEQTMRLALNRAKISPNEVDIISTHATSTIQGDKSEVKAINNIFKQSYNTYINNSKCMIGHCMGASSVLELAGNLPSFNDNLIHPIINIDCIDEDCKMNNMVINESHKVNNGVKIIMNNSFGMHGTNAVLLVKKY